MIREAGEYNLDSYMFADSKGRTGSMILTDFFNDINNS